MIQFEHVYKRYGNNVVVKDFTLNIKENEFFVLIGPSGSGKTTTLKMINQLIPLSEGSIHIQGKNINDYDIQELRWNIGYVLQQIALFPNMTVEENILVVPEMLKWPEEKKHDRVTELLTTVNLDPDKYRQRAISELSGGEQQRIGVVRALAADPDIILMDEPFSALDPVSRHSLQEDIKDLHHKYNKTIVFVTHDMQEAMKLADRMCLMNMGNIEQIGTPDEILEQPSNDFVQNFIKTGLPQSYMDARKTVTVKELVQNQFADLVTLESIEGLPLLSEDNTLDDLNNILSENECIAVQLSESKEAYLINRQHLIQYYASRNNPVREAVS
ncbi:ABC transporter ATP-binding protein [Aerococcaceae bacterium WGS1372]